jgi:hypothetical protein
MAQRLTEKSVEKLGIKRNAYIVWDAEAIGLGIKVTPRGRRIWLAQLRYPGHRVQTRRTLGHFPTLGLADARAQARKWYGLTKSGIDPEAAEADEKRKAEAAALAEALRKKNTFASFAESYIGQRTNRRAKADAQEIRRMLIGAWGTRPLHEIVPRDVRTLIDKLKAHAPYDARNAWTHMVQIFKAAVHEEVIEVSPCASLDRRLLFKGAKITHRQRTLNDDELRAFWRGTMPLGFPAGPFFQLLLLTAVRVSELAKARDSELHPELRRVMREAARAGRPVDWATVAPEVKLWTVPRARFKSDTDHPVTLSNDACRILEGLPRGAGDYLFSLNGDNPVWFGSKFKQRLDARMLLTLRALARQQGDDPRSATLAPWVLHDLRRVVRTNLAELGVEDHVAEMVLGHGRKGLQRIYDQYKYLAQIRAALDAWASKLRDIVEPQPTSPPENVVLLKSARRVR